MARGRCARFLNINWRCAGGRAGGGGGNAKAPRAVVAGIWKRRDGAAWGLRACVSTIVRIAIGALLLQAAGLFLGAAESRLRGRNWRRMRSSARAAVFGFLRPGRLESVAQNRSEPRCPGGTQLVGRSPMIPAADRPSSKRRGSFAIGAECRGCRLDEAPESKEAKADHRGRADGAVMPDYQKCRW